MLQDICSGKCMPTLAGSGAVPTGLRLSQDMLPGTDVPGFPVLPLRGWRAWGQISW
jgi:hypothetical protein